MKVTANGKTFTFPDGTSNEDIGAAIDEYFAGSATTPQQNTQEAHPQNTAQPVNDMAAGMAGASSALAQSRQEGVDSANNLRNSVIDAFTGESRMTPEMQSLQPVGNAPELNAFTADAFRAGLAQLFGSDASQEKILQSMGGQIRQDEKGNAIVTLPSGEYALNRPGLSPQDVTSFAANAAAFTPAARAASVLGAAGKSAATDAVLQGSVQAAGGEDINPLQVAASGILGGAFKGLENATSTAARATFGEMSPQAAQTIANAEAMGIKPMTSDMVKPGNAFTKGLVQGGEGALLGTGAAREAQQAARSKAVSEYLAKFGPYNPDDIVNSLSTNLKGRRNAAGTAIEGITNKMGSTPIQPTNAINAIDDSLAKLNRLGTSADPTLVKTLENLKGELSSPNVDFDLLRQHRTAFRSNVQGDSMVFPNQAKAITNNIENAMTKDLKSSVSSTLGAEDAANYIRANSDYANVYNKVLNKTIANKLNKATNEATPELINSVVYSRNASDIKRIWPALDSKGQDAMRAAYISRIAEKAGDSPARFISEVNKLKSQSGGEVYNTIFNGRYMKELDALHDVLRQTGRADSANVVTQTGQALANPLRIGAAVGSTGTSLAGEAGFGLMMRLYESKPVRNALLRLANTPRGSTAYDRAITNAQNIITPLLQAGSGKAQE